MAKNQSNQIFDLTRIVKKFFLSGFVIFSFIAYVIQQRFTKPDTGAVPAPANTSIPTPQVLSSSSGDPALPTAQATLVVPPTVTPNPGMYKDGVYTGPKIDAYYGLVEVQVTIQSGKIADVQFLQYPNDRNTSVRINRIAMPYLQQEALQAQSAHINIITGATFTSEGFAMSLNEALKTAKN